MFEKVLVPTDFSEYSVKTLECIAGIPGIREVVLVHVVDGSQATKRGWTHEPEIENAKIILAEQKKFLEDSGLSATTELEVITSGDIATRIIGVAEKEQVSLIVMGAHGESLIRGILLGSVVEGVLRKSHIHMLVMRHRLIEDLEGQKFEKFCPNLFSKVLIPMDLSDVRQEAVTLLVKVKKFGEVLLLHVVTKGETQDEIDRYIEKGKHELEGTGEPLTEGHPVRVFIRVGEPCHAINQLAEEEDVSLITLVSHGKGILRELVFGSISFDLVTSAKRPVLVVKPQKK